MIRRYIEICPKCGQFKPWQSYSTRVVHGQRRQYVRCKRCGKRDVIIYFPPQNAQKTDLQGSN